MTGLGARSLQLTTILPAIRYDIPHLLVRAHLAKSTQHYDLNHASAGQKKIGSNVSMTGRKDDAIGSTSSWGESFYTHRLLRAERKFGEKSSFK